MMAPSTHAHLDIRLASRPAGKADGGKTAPPKPTKPKCPKNMINPFACKCGTEKTTTDAGCPKVQCKPCKYKSLRINDGHVHSHAP